MREIAGERLPQREMTIQMQALDWNFPQHIPVRFEAEEEQCVLDERDQRIAQLEAELAAAHRA